MWWEVAIRSAMAAVAAMAAAVPTQLDGGAPARAPAHVAEVQVAHGERPFVAPVSAPIRGRFDHDAGQYGAGRRGVEFNNAPGSAVAAIGDGFVTFAGPVAAVTWVTVQHPNGLRSSLGPMATVSVVRGQTLRRGEVVGTAQGPLHLGIRDGERYVDPERLLGIGSSSAKLVQVPSR